MYVGLMTGFGSRGRWRVCNGGEDRGGDIWTTSLDDDGDGRAGDDRFYPMPGSSDLRPIGAEGWSSQDQEGSPAVLSASRAPSAPPAPPPAPPVMTRAPPPPPPPAPVVVEVATQVYTAQEEAQAATELSAAIAAATFAAVDGDGGGGLAAAKEVVQIASTLAFPVFR